MDEKERKRKEFFEQAISRALADLHRMSEKNRIQMLVKHLIQSGRVAFMVDKDWDQDPGKGDRYISQILLAAGKYGPEVSDRFDGPVKGVETIKIKLTKHQSN